MKKLFHFLSLSVLSGSLIQAAAQGTAFTYQGRLNDGNNPANGNYDLRFAVYTAASGGSMAGEPVTNAATAVSNGLFTVTLDFGSGVFDGSARWLDIGVRTNGPGSPGFTTLIPRQALTPTPYAIQAATAVNATTAASVPASGIGPGTANISISGSAIMASNLACTATLTLGQIAGAGTLSNNIIGNATTANFATNSETLGVILIRGNNTTQYFGCDASAFTNAIAAAQSGDTVQAGPGYYTAEIKISKSINLIGAGRGKLNMDTLQYVGGTRLNGGLAFVPGFSNGIVRGFGIEAGINSIGFSTLYWNNPANGNTPGHVGLIAENVGIVQSGISDVSEALYESGSDLVFRDFEAANISGHGFIIKGASNVFVDSMLLRNCGSYFESFLLKADGTNIPVQNITVRHLTIINTWANACTVFKLELLGVNGSGQSLMENISFSDVFVSTWANIDWVMLINPYYANCVVRNVHFDRVFADCPSAAMLCYVLYSPSDTPPDIGSVTNLSFNNCVLQTRRNIFGPIDAGGRASKNTIYYNITVNGITYYGVDNDWRYYGLYASETNRLSVKGGAKIDTLLANTVTATNFTGSGSGLTFTNAAGASFRLIVNSSTNGFNFVPQ